MKIVILRTLLAVFLLLGRPVGLIAQDTVTTWVRENYTRRDAMIPVRDGVRLFTTVYSPRDSSQKWPILLSRTPFATDGVLRILGPGPAFAREGFIFVYQDVRGRFQSEGEFEQVRPFNPAKKGNQTDEASDTYDTIEWLLANVPGHNGRVGLYGHSYRGFYTTLGILSRHPALVLAEPSAPSTDWFMGDDLHHNGALMLMDAFTALTFFGRVRPAPTRERDLPFDIGSDGYRFHLEAGALANYNPRFLKDSIPFWNAMVAHPNYDAFWKSRSPLPYLKDVKPAVLVVGGWYDHENLWGTLATWRAIDKQSPATRNILVIGPWHHGQWWLRSGTSLGDFSFGSETSTFFHDKVEVPFYNCALKQRCDTPTAKAWVFETGANQWHSLDAWPPRGVTRMGLFLATAGKLSRTAPTARAFVEYVSDPSRPVPHYPGIVSDYTPEYMNGDQRFASSRPDVATWESAPLDADITLAGPIEARLVVSTTGTDSDWIVKLIDVWPDDTPQPDPNPANVVMAGYQQLVRGDVMRGKFRNGMEKPEPFVPGKATAVNFTLQDAFHTFKKGHRIMLQVQSSWFPIVDRNPQQFLDIYRTKDSDFRKATQRIFNSSLVVIPVWSKP